jgi:hypothetical protein
MTDAQREILRVIAKQGSIRSAEAGRIVHAHARPAPYSDPDRDRARWAGSDGYDALARLRERGLVCRVRRGVWELAA